MERLVRFEVSNLFGYLNQDVSLATDQGITILHGANGSGKTTLLKCLADVSHGNWLGLWNKPLDGLILHFESGSKFIYAKTKEAASALYRYEGKQEPLSWTVSAQMASYLANPNRVWSITTTIPAAESGSRQLIYPAADSSSRQLIYLDENIANPKYAFTTNLNRVFLESYLRQSESETMQLPPNWLEHFGQLFRCTLIEEQRLMRLETETDKTPKLMHVVAGFSANIVKEMKDASSQYGEKSNQLERTFPRRLVDAFAKTPPAASALEAKYNEIEAHRLRLEAVGLIESETSMMQLDPANLSKVEVRRLLSLYADDVSQKLSLFDSIYNKIKLFEDLMRAYFAKKTVKISKKGIQITSSETGKELDATYLSSGEQHLFVLFFRLIFKEVGEQHLVLIDEPELSLHPGWQLRFVDDLERIRDVSRLDFILASHSPQIYQGHKPLARDLAI